MRIISMLALSSILLGCAALREATSTTMSSPTVPVTVTTLVDKNLTSEFSKSKFCFVKSDDQQQEISKSFAERRKHDTFIEQCTAAARAKQIVIHPTCDPSTIAIDLQYFSKTNESKVDTTKGGCTAIYSTVICNSKSYTRTEISGSKLVVLEFKKAYKDSWKTVGQGEGYLLTDTPGILKGTVVAACRAIFSALPREVEFEKIEAQTEN